MSGGTYPAFEKPLPEAEGVFVNGKCLSHAGDALDAVAKSLGVMPLGEFFDDTTMTEMFFEDDDPEKPALPPVPWFPAAQGLNTVRRLLDFLETNPDAVPDIGCVRVDLHDLERALMEAERYGIRFNLLVDI